MGTYSYAIMRDLNNQNSDIRTCIDITNCINKHLIIVADEKSHNCNVAKY